MAIDGRRIGGPARRLELPPGVEDPLARSNSEAAGRLFLQTYLEDDGSERLLEVTAPSRPELVPDMQIIETTPADPLSATSVVFQQTFKGYPIFGGRIVVDVDRDDNSFVSINGQVAPLPDVDPLARLSARDALGYLAKWRATDLSDADATPPVLTWYFDEEKDRWHLVYHFKAVAMAPNSDSTTAEAAAFSHLPQFCVGHSPRSEANLYDYFVDAHQGTVVFYFSTTPTIAIPIPMQGQDVGGVVRNFFGMQTPNGFSLSDPLRNLETHDFALQDIDAQPLPPSAIILHQGQNLGNASPAAVSAHYHATLVFNFFNDVLKRKSVDNKGMKLVSLVNVWSSSNGTPTPEWKNARPDQRRFGFPGSGWSFNDCKPFLQWQCKSSDLSWSWIATFKQSACRSATMPVGPCRPLNNIVCTLIDSTGSECKAGGHPIGRHQYACKQVLCSWREL